MSAMNKTSAYDFTIIVPVFDEEDNIQNLGEALAEFIPKSTCKTCVLFVNDGSRDGSLDKIKAICRNNVDFHFISFKRNAGLSAALKAGIDFTESKYLGYMDADLQTTPDDFNLLLAEIGHCSMAVGFRADRKDTGFKKLQSRIANGFRRMMTNDGAIDTGCPLKVLHTDVAKRLPLFKGMHRFLPALVLLQDGATYKQIPVRHFPRKAGVSKYHIWNRLWGPFADCFAYRWMKPRYINYSIGDSDIEK